MGNVVKSKSACRESANSKQATPNTATVENCSKCLATALPERRCARRGKPERLHKATNPFLIFFLRLKNRKPHVRVSTLARVAGERWRSMTCEERKKYVDLAEVEKKRRQGCRRPKRRADRNWSKGKCKRKKGCTRRG